MGGKGAGRAIGKIAAIAMVFGSLIVGSPASAQDGDSVQTSITATFWQCPPGMTAETLAADQCTVITDGFDAAITSKRDLMEPYRIADASFDGTSFTWSPPNLIGPQIDGLLWGFNESPLPAGATEYAIYGDVADYNADSGSYTLSTSYDDPNTTIDVYNFVPAAEPVDSTLEIHQRLCGTNYAGNDPFAECHDWLLDYDAAEYNVYDGEEGDFYVTQSPDPATGNMSFEIPGTRIFITNGASAWPFRAGNEIYCTDTNTGSALTTGTAGMGVGSAVWVEYPAGASIVCDWYILAPDQTGTYIGPEQPATPTVTATATATTTPTPTASATPAGGVHVTSLPNTGSGIAGGNGTGWLIASLMLLCGFGTTIGIRRARSL